MRQGAEAALRRVPHVQLQIAQSERNTFHETMRCNDAKIERLRRLVYGMEVIDVEAGEEGACGGEGGAPLGA